MCCCRERLRAPNADANSVDFSDPRTVSQPNNSAAAVSECAPRARTVAGTDVDPECGTVVHPDLLPERGSDGSADAGAVGRALTGASSESVRSSIIEADARPTVSADTLPFACADEISVLSSNKHAGALPDVEAVCSAIRDAVAGPNGDSDITALSRLRRRHVNLSSGADRQRG